MVITSLFAFCEMKITKFKNKQFVYLNVVLFSTTLEEKIDQFYKYNNKFRLNF